MNEQAIGNSMEWSAKLLRFTGFQTPDTQIKEFDWWKNIVGEPPEDRRIQERQGLLQDVGAFKEGNLILKIEPFRIDWVYQAIENPEEFDKTLGPFNEAIQIFIGAMRKWLSLESLPSLQRIAFGAIILQPVDTRKTGYELLAKYLKYVRLDTEGSQDFRYEINRPRDSITDIADLRINRLMKWSVRTVRLIKYDFENEKGIHTGQEHLASHLELDINTEQDPTKRFNSEQTQKIFDELVQLAIEISQKGDIK